MISRIARLSALALFASYVAVFPGATITVALDRVPPWGGWMGGALLLLQGVAVLAWLVGSHGRRGLLAASLLLGLAWGVEHLGVTAGFPFGRYQYTDALQPQLFGVVPLAIACAWLMVAAGAWQLATIAGGQSPPVSRPRLVLRAATLVLLLDLQIEPVATLINHYWVWIDAGPYYGVPTPNFVSWWLVGLGMALLLDRVLPLRRGKQHVSRGGAASRDARRTARYISQLTLYTSSFLPAYLYLLSTLMFAVVNLARGYSAAGLVGVAVLLAVGCWVAPIGVRRFAFPAAVRGEGAD